MSDPFLTDILPGESNYLLKVHGSYLVNAIGKDFTGCRYVESEIPGCTRSSAYAMLNAISAMGLPQHYLGTTIFRRSDWHKDVEQVMLPLVGDDGCVSSVVGALDYPPLPGKNPPAPAGP